MFLSLYEIGFVAAVLVLVLAPLRHGVGAVLKRRALHTPTTPAAVQSDAKLGGHGGAFAGLLGSSLVRLAPSGLVAGVLGLALMVVLLFINPPIDYEQGLYIRWLYVHASAAVAGLIAFGVLSVALLRVCILDNADWRTVGCAAAHVGWIAAGLTMLSGALWSRPLWGTYWEWDIVAQGGVASFLVFFFIAKAFTTGRRAVLLVAWLVLLAAHWSILYGANVMLALHSKPFDSSMHLLTRSQSPVFQIPLLLGFAGAALTVLGYIFSRLRWHTRAVPAPQQRATSHSSSAWTRSGALYLSQWAMHRRGLRPIKTAVTTSGHAAWGLRGWLSRRSGLRPIAATRGMSDSIAETPWTEERASAQVAPELRRRVSILALALGLPFVAFVASRTTFAPTMTNALGLPYEVFGVVFARLSLAYVAAILASGYFTDRWLTRATALRLGAAVLAAGLLLCGLVFAGAGGGAMGAYLMAFGTVWIGTGWLTVAALAAIPWRALAPIGALRTAVAVAVILAVAAYAGSIIGTFAYASYGDASGVLFFLLLLVTIGPVYACRMLGDDGRAPARRVSGIVFALAAIGVLIAAMTMGGFTSAGQVDGMLIGVVAVVAWFSVASSGNRRAGLVIGLVSIFLVQLANSRHESIFLTSFSYASFDAAWPAAWYLLPTAASIIAPLGLLYLTRPNGWRPDLSKIRKVLIGFTVAIALLLVVMTVVMRALEGDSVRAVGPLVVLLAVVSVLEAFIVAASFTLVVDSIDERHTARAIGVWSAMSTAALLASIAIARMGW